MIRVIGQRSVAMLALALVVPTLATAEQVYLRCPFPGVPSQPRPFEFNIDTERGTVTAPGGQPYLDVVMAEHEIRFVEGPVPIAVDTLRWTTDARCKEVSARGADAVSKLAIQNNALYQTCSQTVSMRSVTWRRRLVINRMTGRLAAFNEVLKVGGYDLVSMMVDGECRRLERQF
jgi:hypothetical protein